MAKIQQFADFNFELGLNTDISEIQVSKKELSTADNVDVMGRGGVRKRFGFTNVNDASYFDTANTTNIEVLQLIEFPRDNGDIILLALTTTATPGENQLCEVGSNGVLTGLQTIYSDRIAHFFLQDKFYFIDPGTEYYFYDGSTVQTVTPNSDEENNLTPIKNCKFAHYHSESNRIFFAGNSNDNRALYYSEFNDPTFVKGTSVVYPTRAEGRVKGINVLMDAIIVSYSHGNWIWRGIDPAKDAIWEKLPTSHGAINGEAFALTTSSLSMVSDDGIFALTPNIMGISMENEAGQGYIMNMTKDRVNKIIQGITNKENVRSVFYSKESKLFVAYSDQESGVNNKILVFDFENKSFSLYTDIQINDFCLLQTGDLYAATNNYILKLTDDSTEDIKPDGTSSIIDFKMKTPKYGLDNPFIKKKLIKMFLIYKNFGSNHELKVSLYADETKVQENIVKGDDSGTEIITKRIKTYHSGNNFQVEIENTQYSEVEIYGIGFYYTVADTGGDKANA